MSTSITIDLKMIYSYTRGYITAITHSVNVLVSYDVSFKREAANWALNTYCIDESFR